MTICRTIESLMGDSYRLGGIVEIDLTQQEIDHAYLVMKREYRIRDIAQNIDNKIEDAGLADCFDEDWPRIVAEKYVGMLEFTLDGNCKYNEQYADMVDTVVRSALNALGINPDTMKR